MSDELDKVQLHLVDNGNDFVEFKSWVGERHDLNTLGFDTETEGLNPYAGHKVRLIQIGDTMHGWAFPPEWHGAALEILRDWEGDWVAHNSKFDVNFLRMQYGKNGLYVPNWSKIHDTMTQAHLHDSTRIGGLKALSGMLIDSRAASSQVVLEKEMTLNNWDWKTVPIVREGAGSSYWIYASLDPVLTCRLHEIFQETRETYSKSYELEMGTVRCIAQMEWRGARVDIEYCHEMTVRIGEYAQQVRQWIRDTHGVGNATSTAQCIRRFQELGREITRTTKSGAPSLDKEQLENFLAEGVNLPGNDLAQALLDLRRGEKMTGPYFKNLIEMADENSRVHPTLWPNGTRTARMSAQHPALQTLPRKDATVRDAFIPSDGNVLVSCDYDQIELRLATHLSRDEGLREAFATGDDFFSVIASEAYREPVAKNDPRRQLMKNGVYACVPLDSEILTQRGWLRHDEVQVGDQTVGYDWNLKCSRPTEITNIVHYDDAPLVRLYNDHWDTVTTPGHRWLANVKHTDLTVWTTTEAFGGDRQIRLSAPFVCGEGLPIADDDGFEEWWRNKERPDPAVYAMQLSSIQRKFVINELSSFGNRTDEWLTEFYRILVFLDGGTATVQDCKRAFVGHAPVWCVQTECETWTMRQGTQPMLTGNTLYGAGVPKIAATAGVTVQAMEAVMAHFHNRYPGIRLLQEQITNVAKSRAVAEGRPYVYTGMGRKMYGDVGREFALTNYAIQSTAAEILKRAICDLDAAGLGEYMILPVHDEIVFDIPKGEAEDAVRMIPEIMGDDSYLVPLTAGADVMVDRWGSRYRKK